MAEETQAQAPQASLSPAQEVVVSEVATVPPPEDAKTKKPALEVALAAEAAAEAEEKKAEEDAKVSAEKAAAMFQAVSFKEESNIVADLADLEKKALDELKELIKAALANNEFSPPPPPPPPPAAPAVETKSEEVPAVVPVDEPPKLSAEEPATPVVEEEEEEAPTSPPAEEEKAVVMDEDGAKTVEAIEETVVPVAAPPAVEPDTQAAEVSVEIDVAEKKEEIAAPADPPAAVPPEEVFIWGVPLLGDDLSDTVLIKFLRARDFKVKEAMAMLKNAVLWRKEFGIEALLEEDLGVPELEKVVFMHGVDKNGHPVCYNVYGEFQNKKLYALVFADEEKKKRFLRWRIQYLEKGIRSMLDFSPGGVSTMVQVTDLKNSIGPGKKELRQALVLLQDNYPEFAAKQIFINVPWWYLAFNRMISTFFTQRTKSKFVFAGPSKSAETLFKYIAPEHVPVQYGGLSKENDSDFTTDDAVIETTLKPLMKQSIEIPVTEKSLLVWELRVLGWDVTYGAEFVPGSEDGYIVIVQKARKMVSTEETVVKDSFKIGEAGKVVLTVDNTSSKRKKLLLYRYKTRSSEIKN